MVVVVTDSKGEGRVVYMKYSKRMPTVGEEETDCLGWCFRKEGDLTSFCDYIQTNVVLLIGSSVEWSVSSKMFRTRLAKCLGQPSHFV